MIWIHNKETNATWEVTEALAAELMARSDSPFVKVDPPQETPKKKK
jgi:hypothetical protein